VCVCVCVCECVCVCVCACVCVNMTKHCWAFADMCMCERGNVSVNTRVKNSTLVIQVHTYICIHTRMSIYIYKYI